MSTLEPSVAAPESASQRRGALYDQCGKEAFSLCVWIVGDERLAADIVYESICVVPQADSVEASRWLLSEVHRRAVAAARSRTVPPTGIQPPTEAAELLKRCGPLSDQQRLILALAYQAAATTDEIAKRLAIPPNLVRSELVEALERIGRHNALVRKNGGKATPTYVIS